MTAPQLDGAHGVHGSHGLHGTHGVPEGAAAAQRVSEGKLDSLGMWDALAGLPGQIAASAALAKDVRGLPGHDDVEHIVVLGMGGSGIAGDVLAAVGAPLLPVPVSVVKSYELPAFVGSGSLVFAVSFSGETEETLEAAEEAFEDGAFVVAVTGGGTLGRLAGEWGVPVIGVPGGIPQPRAGIGAVAIPAFCVLETIGLFPGAGSWIDETVEQLGRRMDVVIDDARGIAASIGGTIPLVYGATPIGSVAAQRFKNQVNENAKSPAFWAAYPELCHNELAGWGQLGDLTRQAVTLVQLHADDEHPQIARRMEWVAGALGECVSRIIDIPAVGESDLAQLFDLVAWGDAVSLHMAAAAGVDPGPIPALSDLKRFLAPAPAPQGTTASA